jgi:hypothetical protein
MFTCYILLLLIKAIHPSAFGYLIFPAAFSGRDNYQDAIESVREAIDAHIELLVKDGEAVLEATNVENWLADADYASVVWRWLIWT